MSDHSEEYKGHTKEYMWVFFALGVLTILELYIPDMHFLGKFGKGVGLTLLAVIKAFAVGWLLEWRPCPPPRGCSGGARPRTT